MGSTKPPSSLSRNSRSSQIRSSPRLGTNTMVSGAKRSALEIIDDIIDLKRSEEHTSELQSRENLVCRLLLEKKKDTKVGRDTVGTTTSQLYWIVLNVNH